jgi:hypothetical protein
MEHDGDGLSRVPGGGYLWARGSGESEWDGRIAVAGADLENVRGETQLRVRTLACVLLPRVRVGPRRPCVTVCAHRVLAAWLGPHAALLRVDAAPR